MRVQITINVDNAAFGEDGYETAQEVKRILIEYMQHRLDNGEFDTPLKDFNGNTVGRASLED